MLEKSNARTKTNAKSHAKSATGKIFYTRWRDGAHLVTRTSKGFELTPREGGSIQTFSCARQLLRAITGHPTGRNWTFDRYFKTGRHSPNLTLADNLPSVSILDLFSPDNIATGETFGRIETNSELTTVKKSNFVGPKETKLVTSSEKMKLGIDLTNRSQEVAKLFYAGFGQRVYSAGYEPEDVLQEVYKGILSRNDGKCPWDPRKSSFGHYVHMVCGCIVANYHRKMNRRRSLEQVGAPGWDHGDLGSVDVGSQGSLLIDPTGSQNAFQEDGVEVGDLVSFIQRDPRIQQTKEGRVALCILPHLSKGYTRAELAEVAQVNTNQVNRAVVLIRKVAKDWLN